jgi:hypothetical protein
MDQTESFIESGSDADARSRARSRLGMFIWIGIGLISVIALTIILLVAILEAKPYTSQRTRIADPNEAIVALLTPSD